MISKTTCCGLREYSGVMSKKSTKEVIYDAYKDFKAMKTAFVIFSCPTSRGELQKLVRYIKANDLGTTVITDSRRNPNSGNMLRIMVWGVHQKNIVEWEKKNAPKPPKCKFRVGDIIIGNASNTRKITNQMNRCRVTNITKSYDDRVIMEVTMLEGAYISTTWGGLSPSEFKKAEPIVV